MAGVLQALSEDNMKRDTREIRVALAAMLCGAAAMAPLAALAQAPTPAPAAVAAPVPLTGSGHIEGFLRDGWEVAGYVAASDIRTLVLLKHKTNPWLVQCSVLIDVTRTPRQVVTCYEVR
jgi:hypothetical protein